VNSILNRRNFIKALGIGIVSVVTPRFVTGSENAARKNNKQPNIILIMSDDVSPDLYGCYGNKKVRTPNIDEMAREGVMFRTCWASALCAPTRALIMTGRYGSRTGIYHNSLQLPQKDGSNELLKYHHSFGKLLKQAGYATAITGKWHCSSSNPESPDGGFDEYCLWESVQKIKNLPGKPEFTGERTSLPWSIIPWWRRTAPARGIQLHLSGAKWEKCRKLRRKKHRQDLRL
jgi:arylsulfatase A-like enzyme